MLTKEKINRPDNNKMEKGKNRNANRSLNDIKRLCKINNKIERECKNFGFTSG